MCKRIKGMWKMMGREDRDGKGRARIANDSRRDNSEEEVTVYLKS